MHQRTSAIVEIFLSLIALVALAACERSPSSSQPASSSDSLGSAATESDSAAGPVIEVVNQVVEASCGECNFELVGSSCDLAVRIDGKSYFVDGFAIDDFGDAHAEDGLCNAIHQARVTGRIEGGRFIATEIELMRQE